MNQFINALRDIFTGLPAAEGGASSNVAAQAFRRVPQVLGAAADVVRGVRGNAPAPGPGNPEYARGMYEHPIVRQIPRVASLVNQVAGGPHSPLSVGLDETSRWARRGIKMGMEWNAGNKKDAIVRGVKGVGKTALAVGKSLVDSRLGTGLYEPRVLGQTYSDAANRPLPMKPLTNDFLHRMRRDRVING
jgi:hypothetical protein